MKPFAKIEVVELPEVSYRETDNIDAVKQEEAEMIRKRVNGDAIVILLEEKGLERSSPDFSKFVERLGSIGKPITFILGSGVGLHESLKEISKYQVSLSKLTFPHNLARILLVEQLYRACMIMSGRSYHK
jgi:23S rRNA (pseudouridine1915-N3)-methyltransferase